MSSKRTVISAREGGVDRGLIIDTTVKKNDNSNGDATRLTTATWQAKKKSIPPISAAIRPPQRLDNDVNATSDEQKQADTDEDGNDYVSKWARNSKAEQPNNSDDGDGGVNDFERGHDDERFDPTDALPPFADDASKALYREIKLLEQQRDEAAKSTRSYNERISNLTDHLHSIRQEIDHTNSLVVAKKSEVSTEAHLLSLSERELGQSLRDTMAIESNNLTTKNTINNVRGQIKAAEDELEKLRTDLNWNQEELEQWATAATKKEEESLALQKYALSDELKIKELTLNIEDLTKISVEKKALLENEVTETKLNQVELEKLAERFDNRHDERRQLLQQWKTTIESMNDRDVAITDLAGQYASLTQKEEESRIASQTSKDEILVLQVSVVSYIICVSPPQSCQPSYSLNGTLFFVKTERDRFQKDIDSKERLLQTKRQDLSSLQESERALKDEVGSLRRETSMVAATMENRRAEWKRVQTGLEDKQKQAAVLFERVKAIKGQLENEKHGTNSEELRTESIEKSVANREKELQQAEKDVTELKKCQYKESQRLAALRKKEGNLIADIQGAQASIQNFTSKTNGLENKRTRQQELLENASYKLQQMETKVARGLGVRSNDEKEKLQAQIESLEAELELGKQQKLALLHQQRQIQSELRVWRNKYESADTKHNETVLMIEKIGLEIFACEQSLKEIVAKREDAMVSHDVTLLDVRRLRDSLREILEVLYSLKEHAAKSSLYLQERREQMITLNDDKMAQLRSAKDERHKASIDLGRLKVVLEKTKSKYMMVSSVNARKGEGEGYESPELKLILSAQRREELQREGDKLDATIQAKENDIKMMQRTLMQLKEMNTNYRSSFSRTGGQADVD